MTLQKDPIILSNKIYKILERETIMRKKRGLSVLLMLGLLFLLSSCASMGIDEPDKTSASPGGPAAHWTKSQEGVFFDSETNMEWFPGPDQDITYEDAGKWAAELTVAGGGWRLPTVAELRTLRGLDPADVGHSVRNVVWFVWSSDKRTFQWSAYGFLPSSGRRAWRSHSYEYDSRVMAVRPGK